MGNVTSTIGDAHVVEECSVNGNAYFAVLGATTGSLLTSFTLPNALSTQGLVVAANPALTIVNGVIWFSAEAGSSVVLVGTNMDGDVLVEYDANGLGVLLAGSGQAWAVGSRGIARVSTS